MDVGLLQTLIAASAGLFGVFGGVALAFIKIVQGLLEREASRSDKLLKDLEDNTASLDKLAELVSKINQAQQITQRDIDELRQRRIDEPRWRGR